MIRNQTSRGDSYLWDVFNQLMGKIRRQLKRDFAVVLVEGAGSCLRVGRCFWSSWKAPGFQLSFLSFSLIQRLLGWPLEHPSPSQPASPLPLRHLREGHPKIPGGRSFTWAGFVAGGVHAVPGQPRSRQQPPLMVVLGTHPQWPCAVARDHRRTMLLVVSVGRVGFAAVVFPGELSVRPSIHPPLRSRSSSVNPAGSTVPNSS